jgi:hypothetical protein
MAKIQMFESVEAMFAEIETQRSAADARMQPWQQALKAGDFVLRYEPSEHLLIWGALRDPVEDDRECGADEDELVYVRDLYASPHMVGFRAGRHYSVIVPDGEIGDIHVSTVLCKLTQTQFDAARAAHWPARGKQVLDILRMDETVPPRHDVFPDFFAKPS